MSVHHPDPVEENIDTHPVKLAIAIAVGAIALVIGIMLLTTLAIGNYRVGADSEAMTPEAIALRIAPVAKLVVDPSKAIALPVATVATAPAAAVPAAAIPAAIPAAATPAGKVDGKAVYSTTCVACHATGAVGAPKFGDKTAWAPRIKTGVEALHASALKGKGAMPPKGGNSALSDAAVMAAVDYMVSQSK